MDEVEDIVSNLNDLRSIMIFAKDNLQAAETKFQDLEVINSVMTDSISLLSMDFFSRDLDLKVWVLICLSASLQKLTGKCF